MNPLLLLMLAGGALVVSRQSAPAAKTAPAVQKAATDGWDAVGAIVGGVTDVVDDAAGVVKSVAGDVKDVVDDIGGDIAEAASDIGGFFSWL